MKRLLLALEVLAGALFFAFAVLVLALRFWILPDIERYREPIVSLVSRTVGLPVKVGAIEAGWLGLRPQITFYDVRVYDAAGREALALPTVDHVISWRSLARGALRLNSLIIDRPRLAVRRDAEGQLYVAGLKLSSGQGSGGLTDWILAQDQIIVREAQIEWLDEKRQAPPLELRDFSLRLRNSGDEHLVGINARPPAALGSALDLRADLAGRSAGELSAWNGRIYVEVGATELAAWRQWVDYPVDVRQGQGALRLWATLQNGQPTEATMDLELARVVAQLGKDLPPLALASVRGRLQARERQGAYEVSGRQLAFAPERGKPMSPADFQLTWQPAGKTAEHGTLSANAIELEPLAQLAEALPFPQDLRRKLADFAPRGRVLDVKLDWTGAVASPERFTARARFDELSSRPREKWPGFAGLSGTLEASEQKGALHIASRKAELELPRVLADPIPLDALNADVGWERRAGRVLVTASSLGFSNPHFEGKAQGSYTYTGEGRDAVDLTVDVSRADGRYVVRYLPLPEIMGKATHDWLAAAIIAGQGSNGHLRLKGELRDFPFTDPSKGQFLVTARVEKGVLNYINGWPHVSDIDAQIHFEADRMEVVGRSATILGARLANVHASIPRLAPGAHLLVNGQADGPTGEFLKYLDASPVGRMIGGFTEGMTASGRGKLNLKVDVPLAQPTTTKIAGEYEFLSNTLTLNTQLPPLERVTGKVSFTESTSAVQDVHGRIFGGAVAISGGSRAGAGVEVIARGDATVGALQPVINHPWMKLVSGSAPYTATVQVQNNRPRILVDSNLRGVASALPPPLSKGAADALPLHVEIFPGEDKTRDRISVAIARLLGAEFLRRKQGDAMVVQRSAVSLSPGGEAVRLPERPGMLIYGTLSALDLDRWLPLFKGDSAGAKAGASAPAADPVSLDLKIGTLDAYGRRLLDTSIHGGVDASGWSATVNGKEIAGDLSYRNERGGQLIARLTTFTVPDEYPGAAKTQDATQAKDFPSVDLAAERFTYRGKQFGRVELVAQRAPDSWRIEKMSMVNPDASLSGHGLWQTAPVSRTSLDVNIESGDAGKFLGRIGYPNLVRGTKARVQANISWAGDPSTPDYPSMAGGVQMQAEEGQFLEIEPGIGKLVSLMSLQALPRRLTLDFRDVFSKGFQFDRIAANAGIDKGVMTVREFKMRGSAAEVEMTGEVDLAKETQNLHVRVIPSLGDSASTVLAFLNPLLVFPAAIAQKILKDPLGHIFSFEYAVTGSWADPKVAKTRVAAQPAAEK